MAQFSRRTILAATDLLVERTHAEIDRFALEFSVERFTIGASKIDKTNALGRYLIENPDALNELNENLTDAIVIALVEASVRRCFRGWPEAFDYEAFRTTYPALHRGLDRDGFTVETGELRRSLPNVVALPQTDDEVHLLLARFNLQVPRGHLDQGIASHARGQWAAANAQFRTFIESLLDELALLAPAPAQGYPPPGHPRRQWLANMQPPFFFAQLNEWTNDGRGFFEALFRRLHPQGAHPGLSDEEDSTYRLHLVLLTSRHLLRRLATFLQGGMVP